MALLMLVQLANISDLDNEAVLSPYLEVGEARELMCSGALLFFSHGQVSRQHGESRERSGGRP